MSGNRARGGRAEFSWEKVKEQSFGERSHYLGASLHARNERGAGNPQWYLNDVTDGAGRKTDALRKEVDEVKKREEELMRAALGLPPLKEDSDGDGDGRGREEREKREARRRRKKEKRERKERKEKKEKKDRRDRKDRKDDTKRKDMGPKDVRLKK